MAKRKPKLTIRERLIDAVLARATIKVECLPEEVSFRGNALASGNVIHDREAEQWISDQLDAGNNWAWFTARVTVRLHGFQGVDMLGCCNYESEASFMEDDYFISMKHEAAGNLVDQLIASEATLKELMS
jgi:hypothetical protein